MHALDVSLRTLATQLGNNLQQYFGADTEVLTWPDRPTELRGNIITLAIGSSLEPSALNEYPITLDEASVTVRDSERNNIVYRTGKHGLACIMLRPLPNERLELVVWGDNHSSVSVAARLVPMLTGTMQPDFVIMTNEMLWKGAEGALAMGFFDSQWRVSRSSFLS